jgi:hypothetical protein
MGHEHSRPSTQHIAGSESRGIRELKSREWPNTTARDVA